MIFLCRLIDSSYNISQLLAFVKHFFNFFVSFQEIISIFVKFLKLFLSCHCCVAVVCCNVEYNTTPFANCQPLFFFFSKFFLFFFDKQFIICYSSCVMLRKPLGVMVSSTDQTQQVPFMFFLILHYFERPASSVRLVKSIHLRALPQYWLIHEL